MIAPRRLLSAVILSALVGIVLGVPSAAAQQVPNTPDPPGVVAKSKTALTVTWTAPTGPAVASYDVQYRKSMEMNWTAGPQDQTRPRADITGLDADTFYDVQVRATNAAGDSGWSDDAQGATALFEADLTVGRHSDGGFTHQVGYRRGHPAASWVLYPPDETGHGMLTSSEFAYGGVTYTIDAIRRDNRENHLVIGYSSDAVSTSGGETQPAISVWPRDWDITFFQTEEIEQFSTALINPDNQIQTGRLDEQANRGGILHTRPHMGAIWNWDRNNLPWTVDQTYSMTIARVQREDTTVTISADPPPAVTLSPTSLTITAGETEDTVMLTATLSETSRVATTVTISANPAAVTLSPTSLTIPAGETENTVTLTATLDATSNTDTPVTVSADPPPTVTLSPNPLTIPTGTGDVHRFTTLTATLSESLSAATTVAISANLPGVTLSPDSLTITAGETTGTVMLTVTLSLTNHPPVFPSPEVSFSVNENTPPGQDIGIPMTAFDGGGERLTYTLDGPDAAAFDLFVTNQFRTKAELDYETKDSYRFVVSVRDSRNAAGEADTETDDTIEVTITVVDLDEAGTVTLTGTPAQLREELTAALHDEDGRLIGITWQWARSDDQVTWTDIDMETSERYTPGTDDWKKYLRATATYTDGHGSGKSASQTTVQVQDPPKVTLHLSPSSINEDGGQSTVTARLATASPAVITVTVSAPAGDVTLSNNRTLTIAAGKTESTGTGTVTLTAVDNDGDGPETKQVQVSGQRNNRLATKPASVTLTITDDDSAPTVTMAVSPDAITENAGVGTLAVMLSHPSSAATAVEVSVDMAEAVTLRPNSLTISVTVSADLPDPPLVVTLSPNSLTILAMNTSFTTPLTVTLSETSRQDTTVTFSADPPGVTLSPNSLTIPAGETEGTVRLTATLSTRSDTDTTVTFSAVSATPSDPPPAVTLSLDSLTIPAEETEGTVTLTVMLSETSNTDTTVTVSADPAAAVTLSPTSLTIPAGETEGTVRLTVMLSEASSADTTVTVLTTAVTLSPNPLIIPADKTEGSVTLTVILSEESSAATTVTVSADPATVTLSPNSLTIPARMTRGTVTLTATLSLMSNAATTVTVSAAPAAVTLSPNSLTIPAGMTRGTVTLTAVDDNTDALNKQVTVSGMASNTHGIAGNLEPRTLLRIQDDDPAPTVTLELAPNPIGENGGQSTLTVGLDRPSSQDTTVTVSADPAAVRLSPNSLTIPAGDDARHGDADGDGGGQQHRRAGDHNRDRLGGCGERPGSHGPGRRDPDDSGRRRSADGDAGGVAESDPGERRGEHADGEAGPAIEPADRGDGRAGPGLHPGWKPNTDLSGGHDSAPGDGSADGQG